MPFSISTVRPVGVPSSSMLSEPRRRGMVPSSITVHSSDATRVPIRSVKAETRLRLKSPSSPWPTASWSRMPGQPGPSTTVIVPAGAAIASRLVSAWRAASRAKRSARPSVSADNGRHLVGHGGLDGRLAERIEVVGRPRTARGRQPAVAGALVRDEARRARGDLEPLERNLVGIRVAGARPREHTDADPLADVPGGLFDDAVLQRGGLIHAELEVALGMIRPPLEGGAEHVLERPVREPEALEEELPGVGDVHPRHRTRASRDRPPACAPPAVV